MKTISTTKINASEFTIVSGPLSKTRPPSVTLAIPQIVETKNKKLKKNQTEQNSHKHLSKFIYINSSNNFQQKISKRHQTSKTTHNFTYISLS
jgi:hypothetical protein